jgi:hypothetical protein
MVQADGVLSNGTPWSACRRRLTGTIIALLCAGAALAGCSSAPPVVRQSGPPQPVATTAPDGRGAVRPLAAPTGCTANVIDGNAMRQATAAARPGDKICIIGDVSDTRLTLHQSGTAAHPITLAGDGRTLVKGISVDGDYVSVDGINALNPAAPGISLTGNHITLTNSSSLSPRGDDGDALRFWGTDITIKHNTFRDTKNLNGAHADCMQTFATDADHPASQNIDIDGNRCEDIANTCLIMEGPHSLAGDGSGVGATSDVVYNNNYCQNLASEALQIDDVQNLTITNNDIAGTILDHAFALQNKSTGAKVSGNKLNPQINFEVGMDDTSKPGYQGPPIGGAP